MCSRQERIQKDVDIVTQRCKAERDGLFSDFRYAESTFTFTYCKGAKRVSYSVHVSDDYPDNTYVSNSENDEGLFTRDPIPVIFHRIATAIRGSNDATSCLSIKAKLQADKNPCHYSVEEDSEGDNDSEEFYYGGQVNYDGELHKHPQLEADLAAVKDLYGPNAVSLREYGAIDDVDIDLHIDVSFLDEEIALAWDVIRREPVTIRLHCSLTQYLNGPVPTVDVFQVSTKDRFGLGHQLKNSVGPKPQHVMFLYVCVCVYMYRQTACVKYLHCVSNLSPCRILRLCEQIMEYAEQRIPVLNEFCVVCDEPHVFQNGPMLRPTVCERELCVFAFQTLGVMNEAADEIATGAQVVDLLVSMCRSALESPRKVVIFEPYPSVVDPNDSQALAFNPRKKDYDRVMRALNSLTSIREMSQASYLEIKRQMDKHDPLAHPLLQWIISSNRSHIVKLPVTRQLKFMHTPHQFLLLSSPPAKESNFRAAKKHFSSTFAFHGSHIENWHSILRNGLVVASNTRLQLHGAIYGSGIYLSPLSSISFGYSGMNKKQQKVTSKDEKKLHHQPQFLQSKNLKCIALCEVITSPDLHKHGDIWVVPNTDHVCTRFFFVYEDGQVGDTSINTQDPSIHREILRVIGNQTATG
uniref:Poly [ADP-ribose] polymerase n=1 Tax=Denticeps clupeoides TaxID=299321 RepID=A0AAY4BNI9_9TELE